MSYCEMYISYPAELELYPAAEFLFPAQPGGGGGGGSDLLPGPGVWFRVHTCGGGGGGGPGKLN